MRACTVRIGHGSVSKVACPALLILGAEDRLTPCAALVPAEAIPSPVVEVLPGAGHTIMVEAPNAMLDALHKIL